METTIQFSNCTAVYTSWEVGIATPNGEILGEVPHFSIHIDGEAEVDHRIVSTVLTPAEKIRAVRYALRFCKEAVERAIANNTFVNFEPHSGDGYEERREDICEKFANVKYYVDGCVEYYYVPDAIYPTVYENLRPYGLVVHF